MIFKKIINQLNILAQCKKHGISLWRCPQFLFLIMGIIIIISIFITYVIAMRYIVEPEIIVLIILLLTVILFIMGVIVTKSFEKLAEVSRMLWTYTRS